jgi:hypothetical protein
LDAVFLGTCTGEYSGCIHESLAPLDGDGTTLASAGALDVN